MQKSSWLSRAHPRSRGENFAGLKGKLSSAGSSPLTRGKPQRWNGPRGGIGLIPAHAGKTDLVKSYNLDNSAHPRSRGENFGELAGEFASSGSSPLTRGKHAALEGHELADRLIPAHAGKTIST